MHVAIAGVGGIGQHILDAVLKTEKHVVTVLTRGQPKFDDDRITWRKIDYKDQASLVDALRGTETCISTVSTFDNTLADIQIALAQACITAGVPRFVPSEFELDPYSRIDRVDFLKAKRKLLEFLEEEEPVRENLEWTIFTCGVFYDYLLPQNEDGKGPASSNSLNSIGFDFILDMKSCSVTLVKGMEAKRIRLTAADDVGKCVARALELTRWPKQIRMSGANISCEELVQLGERVKGKPFDTEWISREEAEQRYDEAKKADDVIGTFKWSMPASVIEGDFGWPDESQEGVDFQDIFPDEEFSALEEFLGKWC